MRRAGAAALLRGEGEDLFGYGAREAVVRALAADPADVVPFGAPASVEEMSAAVTRVLGVPAARVSDGLLVPADPRLAPLAFAHGWRVEEGPEKAVIRPLTP